MQEYYKFRPNWYFNGHLWVNTSFDIDKPLYASFRIISKNLFDIFYREKENEFESKDDFYQNFDKQERIDFSQQSHSIFLQESESNIKSSFESSISQLSEMDVDESMKISYKQLSSFSKK